MNELTEKLNKLKEWISESENMAFFGGAGVSTESGIPDFRSAGGLYNQEYKYPPETIISHSFFKDNTEEFYKFYKDKMLYPDVKPNKAHKALAKLEESGKFVSVITQNIDGLHQLAGSGRVYELHGSVHRNYCLDCGEFYGLDFIVNSPSVPFCKKCGGLVKPDVVLYEESLDPDVMKKSINAVGRADLLIIGGTSLTVYPAGGLIDYFTGDRLVIINKSPTHADARAGILIQYSVGEALSSAV